MRTTRTTSGLGLTAAPSDSAASRRRAFLAHTRHELRTPLNAIIGYSELLIEELEDSGDPAVVAYARDVRRIHRAGKEMLAAVTSLLDPSAIDQAAGGDMAACREALVHGLRTPLTAAIGYCELLLEDDDVGGRAQMSAELARIHRAAERLLRLTDEVTAAIGQAEVGWSPHATASAVVAQRAETPTDRPIIAVAAARLLVVDDDEMNRDLLARRLAREGHEVVFAENGRRAVDLARQEAFDAILLDVLMPEMDGYETLARLRADPALAEIPVIMISALDEMDSVVRCIELGAEDYLPKDFDPVLLRARLGACLEKKALRDRERGYLREIEAGKRRADELLRVILPEEIVRELQATNGVKPRLHPHVAVMFCDVVNFTRYCADRPPEALIADLQELIQRYEQIALAHGVQKIKTVGDAFMATAGLMAAVDDPELRCVRCGLEMLEAARHLSAGWAVRVGIHAGPVVAGVVGRRQYLFDLWGDTVNTAARVESHGADGAVNVSASTWSVVAAGCVGASLGPVPAKGKGEIEIYRVDRLRP